MFSFTKAFVLIFISLLMVGCPNNKDDYSHKDQKIARTGKKPVLVENTGNSNCKTDNSVVAIMKNGSSAVSQSHANSYTLVTWDIITKKITGKIFYPMLYQEISPYGTHVLGKISYAKYRLISFNQKSSYASVLIEVNSISEPQVKFSSNSKYLLINSTPFEINLKNKLIIYDIKNSEYSVGAEFRNIKHFQLTLDSRYLIIGLDDGVKKSILKFDLITREVEWEKSLPIFQRFSELEIGEDTVIVKAGFKYQILDIDTGNKLYDIKDGDLQTISKNGRFALFIKKSHEFEVIELSTGDEIFAKKAREELYLSTCQLNDETMVLYCRNRKHYQRIVGWDLATDKTTSSCISI